MARATAVCMLAAHLSSCMTWKVQDRPAREVLADKPRVIRINGNWEIRQPRIEGDSLVTTRSIRRPVRRFGRTHVEFRDSTVALTALEDISGVEVRGVDYWKTGLAVVGVPAAALVAFVALLQLSCMGRDSGYVC